VARIGEPSVCAKGEHPRPVEETDVLLQIDVQEIEVVQLQIPVFEPGVLHHVVPAVTWTESIVAPVKLREGAVAEELRLPVKPRHFLRRENGLDGGESI